MTKEVLLKIQGLQIAPDEQNDTIEVITPGEYYFRNGKHYFLYEEVMEGQTEKTKNIIKVAEDCMELTKRGVVNAHMLFEKNKQNVTYYHTPYGSLQIGIDAGSVSVREAENEIGVEVRYGLEINQEHLANCRISLTATPKSKAGFQIV